MLGGMDAQGLVGRQDVLDRLTGFLAGVRERGGMLGLTGDPGVGKSALQAVAVGWARSQGFTVLGARGSESETHLPFASLHQLLRPVLARADGLPARQRDALLSGFGMAELAQPDRFLMSLAALELVAEQARMAPVLVSLEDMHWMDEPSLDVIAFMARRIEDEQVVVLASVQGGPSPMDLDVPVEWVPVGGLDPVSAAALLTDHAPDLTPVLHDRVLREADGNPLALLEFPTAMRSGRLGWTELSDELPMSARLERAFVSRVDRLQAPARTLLEVAALDDGTDLEEMLAVARLLAGPDVGAEAYAPAVEAGLLKSDGLAAVLGHSLIGSALRQSMTPDRSRAVHAALAEVLAPTHPDRAAWHRASAVVTADEQTAADLELAAGNAVRRGALGSAVTWLLRAATLSLDAPSRGARLLGAAEIAFELGRPWQVEEIRRQVPRTDLAPRDRSRLTWLEGAFDDGASADPDEVRRLLAMARAAIAEADLDLAFQLLLGAGRRAWWGEPGADVRREVVGVARSAPVAQDDPRVLAVVALAAPLEHTRELMRGVEAWSGEAAGRPEVSGLLGIAAFCTGDLPRAITLLSPPIDDMRAQGLLRLLAEALAIRSWSAMYHGTFDLAVSADEAARLADETGRTLWGAAARIAQAVLGAIHGAPADRPARDALLADAERVAFAAPVPMSTLLAAVQLARGLEELAAGRHEVAYAELRRVFETRDPAHHPVQQVWTLGYLAEAAVATGRTDEARATLRELEALSGDDPPPAAAVALEYSRAALADDTDAEELFRAALDGACRHVPWHRARVELAYGAWLRRHRRVVESRAVLRQARHAFDALGALEWAQRADHELRATGERGWRPATDRGALLSPQESEIARLAALGLSNREIGQRLYLSHRTVGSHLYRIFPKLGVTSRGQLGMALAGGELV